ncbi:MAG: hypothetical protein KGQ59_07565 [Bdellovibrionales bacterium]|nr:hypothetical protein [Bdellovibrionales bacterium]
MFRGQDRDLKWTAAVFALTSISSLWAFAGEDHRSAPAPVPAPAPASPLSVSLEKFRQQCQDPSKSEVQRAPQDIKLICRNQELTWIATVPGEVPLKSVRTVSTAVVSDKFNVAEVSKEVGTPQASGACQRYQEVIEQYSLEVPVSCEDILNGKTQLEDICAAQIDDSKDKNEAAVQVKATGRVIDTCANVTVNHR